MSGQVKTSPQPSFPRRRESRGILSRANKRIKLNDDLQHDIQQKLGLYWSPEQVSGRLRMEENIHISTETIYRMILKDKVAGGSLYLSLRHQSKKYRKRYGKNDYRGIIPNRVDIAQRPSVVDSRSRIGDWEADCIIGKGHKGVFATLAERKSRFYLALPIKHTTAPGFAPAKPAYDRHGRRKCK